MQFFIDDHSRVAFSSIVPNEQASIACSARLKAVRYYGSLSVYFTDGLINGGGCGFPVGVDCPLFAISMLQASRRATVRGPTFVRLLAQLASVDVPAPDASLSDRLSQWLDWNHSIALSTALDGRASADASEATVADDVVQQACARIRATQVAAIAAGTVCSDDGAAVEVVGYASFRQRYLDRQRAMQSATGELRGRLRERLAKQSAQMARLAEVDAAMELALSPREQALLSRVPSLLEHRFDKLQQAALTEPSGSARHGAWLEVFRNDMQSLLLAELDLRFQPVESLLAALSTC